MAHDDPRQFRARQAEGATVVTAEVPLLGPESRDELYAVADRLADANMPRRVVLSLVGVRSLNSAAIGVLVNFHKRVRDAGAALKVSDLTSDVAQVFQLTKLDQVLDLCATEADALAAFREHDRGRKPSTPDGGPGSWVSRLFGRSS
jgi:anti-anti-sigma factor